MNPIIKDYVRALIERARQIENSVDYAAGFVESTIYALTLDKKQLDALKDETQYLKKLIDKSNTKSHTVSL
jgi:hypothetical protein